MFDAHSDLPFKVIREREAGRKSVVAEDFLPGMRAGGILARVAAVYVDDEYLPEMALHRALAVLAELHDDVAGSDGVELATTADDLDGALDDAAVTLVLGMEGAEPLMGDPRLLDAFYRCGVRLLTLTHSRRNAVGEGAPLSPEFGATHRTPGGLSTTGVAVVERAEDLGVVVDVSHLNDLGLGDVLSVTNSQVVASHSNCRAVCDHPRNLTDEQIAAVAETGGVVCLTAVGSYLAATDPTLDDLCDHVMHAVNIAGVEHIGLGFDFFEYMLEYATERERERISDITVAADFKADESVAAVPGALAEWGFSDDEVAAICGKNLLRTFQSVLV
ncbi:dipeptidase [Halegenticoccus tardaugens]|uniref:dipeptidase n=1 Tax=Halegenticoccus tardaugens TaxID=2071624 RepID=UPI0013E93122|nr:membrane dipeptidase [Halegenticoccus tardaugens]